MGAETEAQWCHDDVPRFRAALHFTEATTGFSARLIEKDYYCSLVLHDLAELFGQGLIFKGGTCLSKIHAEFFRLSEDLDFCVSIRSDAARSDRRRASMPFRDHLAALPTRHALFELVDQLAGHSEARQYNGRFAYRSAVTGDYEHIKVELSLREETLLPAEMLAARTLLRDPYSQQSVVPVVDVRALHVQEAYAEKIRAALTRREPAIRDFFDIHYADRLALVALRDQAMIDLVAAKLTVAGNDRVDVSPSKIANLANQLETQLRPVLRTTDFDSFDLQTVVSMLEEVVTRLAPS